METLKIFIGYDPKEAVAFHVLCHSLLEKSSKPISITQVKKLKRAVFETTDQRQSNNSRFRDF